MIHEWLWRSSMIIRRHDLPYIGKRNMSLTCLVLQPTIKFFSHSKCPFKSVKSHSWFHGEKNLGHKKEAKQQFSFLKLFLCHPKPQNPSYPPANAAKPTSSFQLFSSQLRFPNKTQHSSYYLILCTSKVHSSAAKTPMFQLRPLSCSKIWTMDWSIDRWMQGRLYMVRHGSFSWWLNWTGKYDHQIGSFPTQILENYPPVKTHGQQGAKTPKCIHERWSWVGLARQLNCGNDQQEPPYLKLFESEILQPWNHVTNIDL